MHQLIGFDFDSVVVNTDFVLCCILTSHLGLSIYPEDIHHYGLEKNFPQLSPEEVQQIIDRLGTMEETLSIPPIPGAFDFIRWYAKSCPIYLITNRCEIAPVEAYFKDHLDLKTFKKCMFFSTKDKGSLCRKLGITHYIDDCPANIVNLANSGIVPMMFLQNWNVKLFTGRELITQLVRFIHSWEDVYGVVQCEQENII
jgi:hypothetical protein